MKKFTMLTLIAIAIAVVMTACGPDAGTEVDRHMTGPGGPKGSLDRHVSVPDTDTAETFARNHMAIADVTVTSGVVGSFDVPAGPTTWTLKTCDANVSNVQAGVAPTGPARVVCAFTPGAAVNADTSDGSGATPLLPTDPPAIGTFFSAALVPYPLTMVSPPTFTTKPVALAGTGLKTDASAGPDGYSPPVPLDIAEYRKLLAQS